MPHKEDNPENNPLSLIELCRKPLKWRVEATRILIRQQQRLRVLQLEFGAIIGLSGIILGIIIRNALML